MDCIQQTTDAWGFESNCQLKFVNFEAHENHISHETEGLSKKHLVVRRGKPFKLTLLFRSQMWNPRSENLVLEVCLGNRSERIPVQFSKEEYQPHSWSAKVYPGGLHLKSAEVHVCSPVQSSVALHRLLLHLETRQTRRSYSVGDFVLLCNPWLKDDPVYMPMDVQIQEYVKSDYGVLYMGTPRSIAQRPWSFGQYEPGVLEACLTLLEVTPQHFKDKDKDFIRRTDPVYLSRVICAMVNSNDDLGVLEGKWQGGYKDGVNPTEWSGSADILRQWVSSNCEPVRYGQCWVFAAVLCTVMRVLGIPSRVVTVFNAAHDGDANLTIEEFYSSSGEKLNLSKDSIWNFHVWVECWMARGDLGAEFGGWQVVDPTPQERSAGVFCCGPCPVAAVRERCYEARYDTPFVYASVDADVVRVIVREGRVVGRKVDTESVGQLIYTKSLHSDAPDNLTGTYKGRKTMQQRVTMTLYSSAARCSLRSPPTGLSCQLSPQETAPALEVSLSIDGVPSVGENISMRVTVTNRSASPRLLMEHLNAQLKAFNSNPERSFWKAHKEVSVQPGEVLTLHHIIPPAEYEAFLAGEDIVNVAVVIKDKRTEERVLAFQEFNISSPQISVEIEGGDSIQVNKKYTARVSFVNPFTKVLSGAVLTVEGSGLLQGKCQERLLLMQPEEKIEKAVTIVASLAGTKLLMATFSQSSSSRVVSRSFHKVSVTAA
ncbi:protein-glutamine gamma-glutamyltransferase 5-like [Pungitius pungitius]|uniref:protein-glutamine gamma-glutamyltransferase 5-like n=1 Tax=Pungitius pungitius TaxID=134920 RepID=UPI002E153378